MVVMMVLTLTSQADPPDFKNQHISIFHRILTTIQYQER